MNPLPLIKTGQEDIFKSMVMYIINEENSGLSLKMSMLLHIHEQEKYYTISINKVLEKWQHLEITEKHKLQQVLENLDWCLMGH